MELAKLVGCSGNPPMDGEFDSPPPPPIEILAALLLNNFFLIVLAYKVNYMVVINFCGHQI